MNKRYFISIPIFCIWIIVCLTMAYLGQFYSDFLINYLGRKQQYYPYPIYQILILGLIYGAWLLSYMWLLSADFAIRHPFISYTLCSIFPILFTALGLFLLVYASPHLIVFILTSIATTLLHFLLLPVLMPIYRKYVYPKITTTIPTC